MNVLVGDFCDYLGRLECKVFTERHGFWVKGLYADSIISIEAYSLGGHFYRIETEEKAREIYEGNCRNLEGRKPFASFDEFGYMYWNHERGVA